MAGVALGTAEDAIDTFVSLARTKRLVMSRDALAQRETVQEKLGRAESLVCSARSFLLETIRETWALLSNDREVPEELTARNRLASSTAVDNSVAAVDSLFTMAGTSSIYTGRLERCLGDGHVVRQHAVVSASGFTTAGRSLLGLGLGPLG